MRVVSASNSCCFCSRSCKGDEDTVIYHTTMEEYKKKKDQQNQQELLRIIVHFMEVCLAKWLTPRMPDLEVWDSNLAHCVVSLDKELYSTLSLFTQVYKWVPATYCWGVTLGWTSIPSRGE